MSQIILIDICIVALFGLYFAQAISSSRHEKDVLRKSLQPARDAVLVFSKVSNDSLKLCQFEATHSKSTNRSQPEKIAYQIRVVDKTNGLLQ